MHQLNQLSDVVEATPREASWKLDGGSAVSRVQGRRESLLFSATTLAYYATLASLPLCWLSVQIGPTSLPLTTTFGFFLLLLVVSTPASMHGVIRVIRTSGLFWFGNACYLAYLGGFCLLQRTDVHPLFFATRFIFLLIALAVAGQTAALVQREDLFDRLLVACLIGICAFIFALGMGMQMAGISLSELAQAYAAGEVRPVTKAIQMLLSSYEVEGGSRAGEDGIHVFKNAAAEACAVTAAFLIVCFHRVDRFRSAMATLGIFALAIVIVLSLSRSSLLSFTLAILWSLTGLSRRNIKTLGLVLGLALLTASMLWLTGAFGSVQVIGSRFELDQSILTRLKQYQNALFDHAGLSIVFGDGPNYKFDGLRIHNLLVASWVEGGLIALAFVCLQYFAIARTWMHCVSKTSSQYDSGNSSLFYVSVAILIAGVTRTMFTGSGGYYTLAAILCMSVFLGIYANGDFKSSRV